MKLKKRKIKYAALFCLCWFVFLVILVDGVLKFQTLVDYFGSYALVEITLLLLVILPTLAVYRLLAEGDASSAQPTVRSIITAHYTGKTIDGKQFDSSRGGVPLACRLCDLIEGWIIAMQQMHIGDKWELYIPAEMGYGRFSQPGIPGGSTLIFEIELLGVA